MSRKKRNTTAEVSTEEVSAEEVQQPEPVNPIEAAAALAEEQAPPVIDMAEPEPTVESMHFPVHLVSLREDSVRAEVEFNRAAEDAKSAKKTWEAARAKFERAFDAEVRRETEPTLPFDGTHMDDTLPQDGELSAAIDASTIQALNDALPDGVTASVVGPDEVLAANS